jgi:hypothetical protein
MSDVYYTKEFTHKANTALRWLPKPPLHYGDHKSYFTAAGNEKFVQQCLLLFEAHILFRTRGWRNRVQGQISGCGQGKIALALLLPLCYNNSIPRSAGTTVGTDYRPVVGG